MRRLFVVNYHLPLCRSNFCNFFDGIIFLACQGKHRRTFSGHALAHQGFCCWHYSLIDSYTMKNPLLSIRTSWTLGLCSQRIVQKKTVVNTDLKLFHILLIVSFCNLSFTIGCLVCLVLTSVTETLHRNWMFFPAMIKYPQYEDVFKVALSVSV